MKRQGRKGVRGEEESVSIAPLLTLARIRGVISGGTLSHLGAPNICAIIECLKEARDEIDRMLIHAERAGRLALAREMGVALREAVDSAASLEPHPRRLNQGG